NIIDSALDIIQKRTYASLFADMNLLFRFFIEKYSTDGNHEAVVELDSSTDEKFSRHLIIRLPKVAFKDNSHVGAFVSEIEGTIEGPMGNYTRGHHVVFEQA
ncbi:hypothetical protein HPP92_028539, partial [Vanilla planifolia]